MVNCVLLRLYKEVAGRCVVHQLILIGHDFVGSALLLVILKVQPSVFHFVPYLHGMQERNPALKRESSALFWPCNEFCAGQEGKNLKVIAKSWDGEKSNRSPSEWDKKW